jgi:hypothetical protein
MKYQKKLGGGGKWVDKAQLTSGQKAKIVTETEPVEGQYGSQDVCKVRFEGQEESVNLNLNGATINALVEAFGEDSKEWINKTLTVQLEKMVVSGKRVTALYLIPEGFALKEDDNGYLVISKDDDVIPF